MNSKRISKRFISKILLMLMILNSFGTVALATEAKSPAVTGKPLVILMEYADYKFSDIDEREAPFGRIKGTKGSDFTAEHVSNWFFGEGTFTDRAVNGKEHKIITIREALRQMSDGTYDFNGQVVGPYTAKHNAKYYGREQSQDLARLLVEEAIEAASKDPNVNLEDFDVETRFRDVNTNETHITYNKKDGQIDTVIVIHPGLGNEMGGGSVNDYNKQNKVTKYNAVHPFRRGFTWYGGEWDLKEYKTTDNEGKEWRFDDFVIMAQDGATDIILHEFGHILGLPDLYAYNGQAPVQYWDIMGGSYTGDTVRGGKPISYGAYNREYLQKSFKKGGVEDPGWAVMEEIDISNGIDAAGYEFELNESNYRRTGKTDLIRINLPDREMLTVKTKDDEDVYFSGIGNNLRSSMISRNIDLTNYEEVFLEFKTWYDIDPGFDFASVRVSEAGKDEWETVEGNITTEEFADWLMENEKEEERKQRNPGHGITGASGNWVDAEFNLSKYAGKEIDLKFYFFTDTNTPEEGIYIDDILISGIEKPKVEEVDETEEPKEEPAEDGSIFDRVHNVEIKKGERDFYFDVELTEDAELTIVTEGEEKVYWNLYKEKEDGTEGDSFVYKRYEDKDSKTWGSSDKKVPAGKYKLHIYKSGMENVEDRDFKLNFKIIPLRELEAELNKVYKDTLKPDSNKRIYKFTLEEAIELRVDFTSEANIDWRIKDSNGDLKIWKHFTEGNKSNGTSVLEPGDYTMVFGVNGLKRDVETSFKLTEQVKKSDKPTIPSTTKDPSKAWETILTARAIDEDNKFEFDGFTTGKTKVNYAENYYLLEWRNAVKGRVDEGLKYLNPWNSFSYDPGMLVWYINTNWVDGWGNIDQESANRFGHVHVGVVDADQDPVVYYYGATDNLKADEEYNQMHDASFGLKREAEYYNLWSNGTTTEDMNPFMNPDFSDDRDYSNKGTYYPDDPLSSISRENIGLNLENHGLKIMVLEEKGDRSSAKVRIMDRNIENNKVDYSDGLNIEDIKIIDNSLLVIEASNKGNREDLASSAHISYRNKITGKKVKERLVLDDGLYKASLNFMMEEEIGDYEIDFIILEDKALNARAIYNSNVHSGYGADLSKYDINNENFEKSDFEPKEELAITNIVTKNKDGKVTKEFTKGNIVDVEARIEYVKWPKNALIMIEAVDSEGVPYALRTIEYDGNGDYSIGFSTYEAKKGINKINVYAWNNLVDKKPLADVMTYEFELK